MKTLADVESWDAVLPMEVAEFVRLAQQHKVFPSFVVPNQFRHPHFISGAPNFWTTIPALLCLRPENNANPRRHHSLISALSPPSQHRLLSRQALPSRFVSILVMA